MVKVWKVGGPGECEARFLHTHGKKGSKPPLARHAPRAGGGGVFACEQVMGRSRFSVFEVFSRIPSLRSHVTVVGYGFWKFTPKTGG